MTGPLATVMRRPTGILPLCVLFFLSGACGLTYQVLWLRLLSLVFGVIFFLLEKFGVATKPVLQAVPPPPAADEPEEKRSRKAAK